MSGWSALLVPWTLAAVAWWAVSLVLVLVGMRRPVRAKGSTDARRLSIFKPIAGPLDERELLRLARCLGSFVTELDARSELLVGVTEQDLPALEPLLGDLRRRHPAAELKVAVAGHGGLYPNRKVSLLKTMSRHATGELWLWSDADMIIPRGGLAALRADLAAGDASFVTAPYIVRDTARAAEMLDKLFVNLEIHPGALLLDRCGVVRFGFGSGVLFEASRFQRRVDWDFLGSSLADDYHLGRLLGHGRLATTCFTTLSGAREWRGALLHYLRWHKTIRWCRPASYAAQLLVLPVVGWLIALVWNPFDWLPWVGLGTVVAVDAMAACAVGAALASPIAWRDLPAVAGWSVLRGVVWLACWLPWPIVWRGQRWWAPRRLLEPHAGTLHADHPPKAG